MRFPKILLLSIVWFFGIQFSNAQQIMPGYYIDNEGVQHSASFMILFDQENYKEFEIISGDQERKLLPDSVQEVGFENGRLFQSEIMSGASERVFVLILRKGEVDLLKWQNQYFIRRGEDVIALKEINSTKEENGQQFNVTTKQYQGVLLAVLKPSPEQVNLSRAIKTANLNDRDLSKVIDLYHELNGLSQKDVALINQGPSYRIKFKVQVGAAGKTLMNSMGTPNFDYTFNSGISPYFEIGARFRDFKNAPRLMVDLGIGYFEESDQLLLTGNKSTFDWVGKQEFTSSSIVLPLQLNYIISKGKSSEWYAGAGVTFWIIDYKNESTELILENTNSSVDIPTDGFVIRKTNGLSPNLKLGWNINLSKTTHLFIEAKVDILYKNYEMNPLNNYSVHNLGVLTLSTGIAF